METRDKIAAYLLAAKNQMFCDACIAAAVGLLRSGLVTSRITSMLKPRNLQRGIGTCSGCGTAGTVTKAL